MKIIRIFLGAGALMLVAGCASQRPYVYSTPASTYDYNAALETKVRAEVNRYGDLASASPDLRIHARDGVVTLRGTVPTERERQMLDDVVRNTTGVVTVNDEMQVNYPPTGAPVPRVYSTPPATVVTTPAPVVVPGTPPTVTPPSLVVQASTDFERHIANRILEQFHGDNIPAIWVQNVSITVSGSDIYVRGYVEGSSTHEAILASLKRVTGVRTVFDELQVR